jgi:endo-1,3(4)-beta-glucanase
LLPHTPLVRTPEFVREEWETYFSGGREGAVTGGWKGVIWGSYATVDPRGAYQFFAGAGFDPAWLDGGASLTWYLCYSAGELLFFSFFSCSVRFLRVVLCFVWIWDADFDVW